HEQEVRIQKIKTRIRVINRTDNVFARVYMFSMAFGDLGAGDTSQYKVLNYNSLKDDPLIYCEMEGENLARYLQIPDKNRVFFSYSIDSIVDKVLYISSRYEN